MTAIFFALATAAAALDPAQMAAQMAAQAAQQQQQQQPAASTATTSNWRPLQAPVIKRKTPAPAPRAADPDPIEGEKKPAAVKLAGGGRVGSVRLPLDSNAWEPVAVRASGEAGGRNVCSWRLKAATVKGKKTLAGKTSPAKAVARLFSAGEDKRLVVSIFPKGLEEQHVHLELRLTIVEGILEKPEIAAVTAEQEAGPLDDAATLRAKGAPFQEEFPVSADLRLKTLGGHDAGTIKAAEFAERMPNGLPGLGLVRCDFDVKETR